METFARNGLIDENAKSYSSFSTFAGMVKIERFANGLILS